MINFPAQARLALMNDDKQHPAPVSSDTTVSNITEAADLLQQAVAEQNQGNLLHAQTICKQIIEIWPEHAEAHHLLGLLCHETGEPVSARKHLLQSIEIAPDSAHYHANLGLFYYKQKRPVLAEKSFEQALLLNPQDLLALVQLGNLYFESKRPGLASEQFRKALYIQPNQPVALYNLGSLLQDEGSLDQALECYDKVLAQTPNDGLKIKRATALPVIIASHKELITTRSRYANNLDRLLAQSLTVKDPIHEVGQTGFYLTFHGLDDRPLQKKLAALYEQAVPDINYVSPHCQKLSTTPRNEKIRIGFISEFFRAQTVGMVIAGIINRINRRKFNISVFHFPKPDDDKLTNYLRNGADSWVELPENLEKARSAIEQQHLDILVYTDIGMSATTYFLAFSRLAPVQCVTWGHPVTTGIKTIDYYISCEDFESEDADEHYSEQLIRLKSPPTYYHRPKFPGSSSRRSDYGLSDKENIYLCVQNLFKVHPDFDTIAGEILRQDINGRIVFLHGSREYWGELLMERFHKSIPDVVDRITLLPRQPFEQYLNLLRLADVALDTTHFGGGSTAYQCFAAGLPIVTLPGKYMRSRFTLSCYRRMDITDCIAENADEYIRIATHLGMNKAWRKEVSDNIAAHADILYEDKSSVYEFEIFFTSVCP